MVAPYPELSRINHEHGTVPIQITVSEYGQVVNAKLVGTSGYERLDTAALKAVKNTSFIPAKQGYNSIEHTYIINITY
ncbi:energy transducer TonB [Neisseria perflava]|uniref:energy transducer TonB n=1 Tax=Neisseria perflava TaxID=33053 RepID=UPI003460BF94